MISHVLDTNAMIHVLNKPHGSVINRMRSFVPGSVAISSIAMFELYYGAFRSERQALNIEKVDTISLDILPFEIEDGRCAAEIRAILDGEGQGIGLYDILIAGQARARDITLVTANRREFDRVPGLRVEDWS